MHVSATRVYRKLRPSDLPEIRRHLLGLSPEDRYLRFHRRMGDEEVVRYAYAINWFTGVLIGCFVAGRLRGMVEISFDRLFLSRAGEASLSVEGAWQAHGVGLNLLQRARRAAANRGLDRLVLYYLPENTRIMRMIRTFGGTIDYTEKAGVVPVGPFSTLTLCAETADEISAFASICYGMPRFPWPPEIEPGHARLRQRPEPSQPAAVGG